MFQTGQVLRGGDRGSPETGLVLGEARRASTPQRSAYLVQVSVEDPAVAAVSLSAGLAPGRLPLKPRPHPVTQGSAQAKDEH